MQATHNFADMTFIGQTELGCNLFQTVITAIQPLFDQCSSVLPDIFTYGHPGISFKIGPYIIR